jgi:wyosine [tRNA(Phe)-imidazoG37] synthetase (radical SAM superfamily)
MYKYLFGPVPSRRLGMSLGIDLVPRKVCSLDCVYCEVGKTTKLTTERKEYILFEKVVEELEHYFSNNPDPEYFTLSGSGEPTLNQRFGDVLNYIKSKKPHIPAAVLTNGTLLYDPGVRAALMQADLVLPSLDAATEEAFHKINRPDPAISLEMYIDGLISFSQEFTGKIWLEVFVLKGFNDSKDELNALKSVIERIKPDRIQLNSLDRPGTETNLESLNREELQDIVNFWKMENVDIISRAPSRKDIPSYRRDAESAILETIARRPCTLSDLSSILGMHVSEINKYLDVLEADNKIKPVPAKNGTFYQITDDL